MAAQRNAFVDPITGYLVCHGFVETNNPGETIVPVPEDFILQPYHWKYQAGEWVAAAPPAGMV